MSSPHEQGDNTNQQGESSNQLPLDSFSNDQPQIGWNRSAASPEVHYFERLIVNDLIGCEPQDEHTPGGYYNVKINRAINSKYQIIKKIGWGAYSTVYMAKDSKANEYLALKFTKSDTFHRDVSMKEIEFLEAMAAADQTSMGAYHVVRMKDWFSVEGENGIHLVMGLEMLGPSVFNVMNNSNQRMFHLDNVRKVCRQLLEAVSFLHDECRIIHGDIKPENIMLSASQQDIQLMDPLLYPPSNTASYDVNVTDPNCEIHIKLGDFGCSRFEDQPTTRLVQTCNFRAPEVFFKAGFDKEADIWSVGCVVYELVTGKILFTCNKSPDPRTHDLHHLTQISECFGPIMPSTFFTGDNMQYVLSFFEPDGKLMNQQEFDSDSLSRKVMTGKRIISKEDVNSFIQFLQLILSLNPNNRPSAEDLLSHAFLLPLGWFALTNRAHEEQPAPVDEVHNLLDVMDRLHISSEKQ